MSQIQHQTDAVFLALNGRPQDDPMFVLERWLGEARSQVGFMATAMSLATVSPSGDPDVRVVLLQSIRDDGLVFFTNLTSTKGKHMLATGKAAACFHWPALARQIRVRGTVRQVTDAYADQYFAGRPRGSQIGAHASAQSSVIADRSELISRATALENSYAGAPVPRPAHWSGLCLVPSEIEFWEDGADRLHDRMLFTRLSGDDGWSAVRLAP
ncbi:MAG TPA: pyridoxamine 5'-phosphate oxidase [Devosia sp.]|nr:pyridoxamine 5'-phosphate oxidase [Devosia sp.]